MSKEIKLAKSNTDSGRITDSALRQKVDERTQLRGWQLHDGLRNHEADAKNSIATEEEHQMGLIHTETHDMPQTPMDQGVPSVPSFSHTNTSSTCEAPIPPTPWREWEGSEIPPETDLFEEQQTQDPVLYQSPSLLSIPHTTQRCPPSASALSHQSAEDCLCANSPHHPGALPVSLEQPPGDPTFRSSSNSEQTTFSHLEQTSELLRSVPSPTLPGRMERPKETPSSSRSPISRGNNTASAGTNISAETLLKLAKKNARKEDIWHVAVESPFGCNVKTQQDTEAAFAEQAVSKDPIPEKQTGLAQNDPHKTEILGEAGLLNTQQIKIQKKSRTDRMLKNPSAQRMDPNTTLRTGAENTTVLLEGGNESPANTAVSSFSRSLKRPSTLRLLAGAAMTASSTVENGSDKESGIDCDVQKVSSAYRKGIQKTRFLVHRAPALRHRQAQKRAAQAGRSATHAAGSATGKAATGMTQTLSTTLAAGVKKAASYISVAAKGAVVPVVAVILAILLVVLLCMTIFTSAIGSPYGIFLVHEQQQELEFDAAVRRLTNSYYNKIFSQEIATDYETVEVVCHITDSEQTWKEMTAVYAVAVCKEGMDAMTMDSDHYEVLQEVFWQKIKVTFRTTIRRERVETVVREAYSYTITRYYDANGNETDGLVTGGYTRTETVNVPAEIEVHYVIHRTLHVTVTEKTLEQLEQQFDFTDGDKETVEDLLSEPDDLWSVLTADFTNLMISSGDVAGTVDVTSYATVGETVYRALRANGYSKQSACGILGNIQQECSMNPQCWTGRAYGLCQWMDGRLENLQRLSDWQTAETQTGFMISELNHSPGIWSIYGGSMGYTYSGVKITSLSAFQSCTNVKAAAGAFCVCFERSAEFPGDPGYDNRLDYAVSWYNYAQSHWEP